jgi:hypothetical protein
MIRDLKGMREDLKDAVLKQKRRDLQVRPEDLVKYFTEALDKIVAWTVM